VTGLDCHPQTPLLLRPDRTEIARRLEALASLRSRPAGAVPTKIVPIDAALPQGGLGRGIVHEWIGTHDPTQERPVRCWSPSLGLITQMAKASIQESTRLVWVGQSVWPYPASLTIGNECPLSRCLFVRASKPADRLWATDLALRCGAVPVVIADGSGFDLASTRRLQLAAEAGGGLCLLARPPWEHRELSAAATRWLVSYTPSPTLNRRWTVELLRCKGMQPAPHAPRVWTLERDHATRALRVAADVLDRPGEAQARSVRRFG
jgi:protein ImuA